MLPTLASVRHDRDASDPSRVGPIDRATDARPVESKPADQWSALAQAISGRGRVRVSRDGGRTYPRRNERAIADLPNQPAAVLIYDRAGAARTFCVDLDVSRGGLARVERDHRALTATLTRLGIPHFADRSPNGGIHVYVPLGEPLPYPDARAAALALAARMPSMDPMPMLGIDSGCIRPPGARHSSGGHQQLIGSLSAAYDAVRRPGSAAAWQRFVDELAPVAPQLRGSETTALEQGERLTSRGRHSAPDARYQQIARTGDYDTGRYATASEARQAVIWAAVAAGWALVDVARRLQDGTWPGLAAMYARYRPDSRHGALMRDWKAAVQHEKQRRSAAGSIAVRVGPTSRNQTHARGVHEQVRTWLNAARVRQQHQRDALASRAVVYALAEAAVKAGDTTVEFGNRSLAIATGLDQRTVGKVLKQLQEHNTPLVTLALPAKGVRANAWTLVVPSDLVEAAQALTWRRGHIHAIRPAFRELGLSAAFTYAALEHHRGTVMSGRELAETAGLGHTAGYEALEVLAAHGLAERVSGGWVVGNASLDQLAEAWGVHEQIRRQLERYRAERRTWWARLGVIRLTSVGSTVGTYAESPPPLEPPPEPGRTLLDLLEDLLGAHVIAVDQVS